MKKMYDRCVAHDRQLLAETGCNYPLDYYTRWPYRAMYSAACWL